jgi:hypothetical protein
MMTSTPLKTPPIERTTVWGEDMTFADFIWLALAAYALHILEEYQLDWRNWARAVIKLPVEWSDPIW